MCITYLLYRALNFEKTEISYGRHKFSAYLADSPLKRSVGLMHRKGLGKNEAMLFALVRDSRIGIWMLNMKFSIDIIWLDGDGIVIDKKEEALPCESFLKCRSYYPASPARYVVETTAGVCMKLGIRKGGKFTIGEVTPS